MTTIFFSCKSQNNKEKKKFEDDLNGKYVDSSFINVIMENDSLNMNSERGVIKFFYKVHDSLKLSPKDERRIIVIFALSPHKENKKGNKAGVKIEKEISFSPINPKDTISIPFSIKPHFSGKGVLVGILLDIYKLHNYDSEKVRVIEYDNTFEKEVYVKENSRENSLALLHN